MNPSEFLDVLERLRSRLGNPRSASLSFAERRSVRSVVGAWFSVYKRSFAEIVGEENYILSMDEKMQDLMKLAAEECSRRTAVRAIASGIRHYREHLLLPLSRAYWARAPQRSPAGRDDDAAKRLRKLDGDLADSYEQAVIDIENEDRVSYRGPAAELREVLTGILHILAPNAEVEATDWYREARRSGARKEPTPTRSERTKYILRSRVKGSAVSETAESYMRSVEDRLADLINTTYRRGSAATHGGGERSELQTLLPYINALLRELLPL